MDDLQWADFASLKLIKLLITQRHGKYLLIIGAFRDDEVNLSHPLNITINQIKNCGINVNHIFLQNLDLDSVSQLIADTLKHDLGTIKPLSEIILNKTNGNPFFINQLLQTLHRCHVLLFNYNTTCWNWDLEEIRKINVTENVVGFLANKINNLQKMTQDILKIAACIGNHFGIKTLSIVAKKPLREILLCLNEAIQEGLILPISGSPIVQNYDKDEASSPASNEITTSYYFVHDKVQQAIHSLLPANQKQSIHLKIGRIMIKHIYHNNIEENIFDIVNQFNSGIDVINQKNEKRKLAKLNLIAGKKAKASTAYQSASIYLETAQKILTEDNYSYDKLKFLST